MRRVRPPGAPRVAAVAPGPGVGGEDSAAGAWERQRAIERAAYDVAAEAIRDRTIDVARLVQVHAQAAANVVRARADVLDLEEREGRLVSVDWVRRVMTEHDGQVVALVKSMPRALAVRIAPEAPDHAERELAAWVEDVFLKTLHGTTPFPGGA